jgi:hypothetical protein
MSKTFGFSARILIAFLGWEGLIALSVPKSARGIRIARLFAKDF